MRLNRLPGARQQVVSPPGSRGQAWPRPGGDAPRRRRMAVQPLNCYVISCKGRADRPAKGGAGALSIDLNHDGVGLACRVPCRRRRIPPTRLRLGKSKSRLGAIRVLRRQSHRGYDQKEPGRISRPRRRTLKINPPALLPGSGRRCRRIARRDQGSVGVIGLGCRGGSSACCTSARAFKDGSYRRPSGFVSTAVA